jgi:hypothetical protein
MAFSGHGQERAERGDGCELTRICTPAGAPRGGLAPMHSTARMLCGLVEGGRGYCPAAPHTGTHARASQRKPHRLLHQHPYTHNAPTAWPASAAVGMQPSQCPPWRGKGGPPGPCTAWETWGRSSGARPSSGTGPPATRGHGRQSARRNSRRSTQWEYAHTAPMEHSRANEHSASNAHPKHIRSTKRRCECACGCVCVCGGGGRWAAQRAHGAGAIPVPVRPQPARPSPRPARSTGSTPGFP